MRRREWTRFAPVMPAELTRFEADQCAGYGDDLDAARRRWSAARVGWWREHGVDVVEALSRERRERLCLVRKARS